MGKLATSALLVVVAVVAVVSVVLYHGYRKRMEREAHIAGIVESVDELAARHGALTDWNENIHYTIQLQDLLIGSGRPVLFAGIADDIYREGEEYYVRFLTGPPWSSFPGMTEIHFVLRCDSNTGLEIAKRMESVHAGWLHRVFHQGYAVVATIERVTKLFVRIEYFQLDEEELEPLEFLEYKPSDTFMASGELVDLLYLGEDWHLVEWKGGGRLSPGEE